MTDDIWPVSGPPRNPFTYEIAYGTGRGIVGDPAMCREHIQWVRDKVGIDRLALRFDFGGLPQEVVLASMRRFAAEVAPHFNNV